MKIINTHNTFGSNSFATVNNNVNLEKNIDNIYNAIMSNTFTAMCTTLNKMGVDKPFRLTVENTATALAIVSFNSYATVGHQHGGYCSYLQQHDQVK